MADAGENQIVNEDTLVTLDGNNSYDNDGNITSYSWIQSDGEPSVTRPEMIARRNKGKHIW